jgi:hypothetical protein
MNQLFNPVRIGRYTLPNRLIMAALARIVSADVSRSVSGEHCRLPTWGIRLTLTYWDWQSVLVPGALPRYSDRRI